MITPNFLKKGDTIGIVAPARKISSIELKPAADKLKKWGLNVVFAKNINKSFHQFAGNDEVRLAGFQSLLDDDNVQAIIAGRGGYGTIRIIEKLNFDKFVKNPKWIIGYSDITVLHSYIHEKFGIETMHAVMPVNFPFNGDDSESILSLKKAIFGESLKYHFDPDEKNREGSATGQLVGGNLSVLYSMRGTSFDLNTDGKILFIEDLDEYLYHIDRMIMNFKIGGKFDKIKGLIVGALSDMNDNLVPYGKDAYEIVADAVKDFNFPVCFNFPAGHIDPNEAMIFGRKIKMSVTDKGTKISFE
ncbi:MAG: LD-carboxypeptidase [Bacteroidetes bacterium GWF2_38_335]|nr:MAG: LD-carboxypeptidase [Bacteroidetes bacterium GWF2_38_335]OFY77967.1 MAG: LD-carboxypeptidase [Bacteroidetes bacterium RIFOXYA12_FULL_38_20]HBS86710.1 LD-carboxypeptidase [Bacteroidales bacterium]